MTGNERRVVFVSQQFPPDKGGNAARIHDITTHLGDQGWEVTVLAPPPSYPPGEFDRSWRRARTEAVDGVTVHRLWSWQPMTENPGMMRRLAYYVLFGVHAMIWLLWNVRRYDVVVTTTPPISTGAPGLVAATLGKPWVVDVRDLWIDASISLGYLESGSVVERISRRFQRKVLHTADRISVTTETLGRFLAETYGESLDAKTIVIPNGVDTRRFQPASARGSNESTATRNHSDDTPQRRERSDSEVTAVDVQPDGGRPTIIYTGNLGTAQDLESCIRAMAHLPNDGAVFRLVGGGDVESELRHLTHELDLHDRIEFEGIVPRGDVPALLRGATIGVAPLEDTDELEYAMPTKVYEYMASGLPTVVTGNGEIERFVDASGGGVHVENDPERIAERLEELLQNGQLRRQLAKNGRKHVKESYRRQDIARRLGDELDRLVVANAA